MYDQVLTAVIASGIVGVLSGAMGAFIGIKVLGVRVDYIERTIGEIKASLTRAHRRIDKVADYDD